MPCEPGTYSMSLGGACEACPSGFYQPQYGQGNCVPCSKDTDDLLCRGESRHGHAGMCARVCGRALPRTYGRTACAHTRTCVHVGSVYVRLYSTLIVLSSSQNNVQTSVVSATVHCQLLYGNIFTNNYNVEHIESEELDK